MKKLILCFVFVMCIGLTGCKIENDAEEAYGESSSEEEREEKNTSEVISETIPEEELVIYVCKEDIIDEKTALDRAYAFYYEGSDMEQYSVFCEELPRPDPKKCMDVQSMFGYSYADSPKMGYVVVQYSSQINTEMEKYDPSNEVLDKNMTLLMPLGISSNGAFYQFWLCSISTMATVCTILQRWII